MTYVSDHRAIVNTAAQVLMRQGVIDMTSSQIARVTDAAKAAGWHPSKVLAAMEEAIKREIAK